jgi:hypothetical protein
MPYVLGLVALMVVLLVAKSTSEEKPVAATKPPEKPEKKGKRTLNDALLDANLKFVPDATTVLSPGNPILDVAYGGRLPDMHGGPAWKYYQTYLDDAKKSGGTTCSTWLAYVMALAGWPAEMIDRSTTDPAPGGGFTPGWSMTKIVAGAQRKGWYRKKPAAGDWQRSDVYHIDHAEKPNSDHVGQVLEVGDPQPDGTRRVVTLDGGQGQPGYHVQWQTRILSADGSTLTLQGVPARVLGLIRADAPASA